MGMDSLQGGCDTPKVADFTLAFGPTHLRNRGMKAFAVFPSGLWPSAKILALVAHLIAQLGN